MSTPYRVVCAFKANKPATTFFILPDTLKKCVVREALAGVLTHQNVHYFKHNKNYKTAETLMKSHTKREFSTNYTI